MIAHNCRIGKGCIILALAGLAGSVEVGDGAILSGQVSVRDHVKIGSGARIGGRTALMSDVADGASMLGMPAAPARETLRQWAALRKLPDLLRGRPYPDEVDSAPRRPLEPADRD
jgi:UDP-3-O-[3-hydroxymyristoyl] glucosamine N-acyltransferase